MIELQNLTRKYGDVTVLDHVTLSVYAGEVFAYLGPNGAGKTTTINVLTGTAKPTSGTAKLNGHDILTDSIRARRQFGVVPQHMNLDVDLSVWENLLIHGMLFGMSRMEIRNRADYLLEYIDLVAQKDMLVKKLSGGMRRRVLIARALLHEPTILFLDEPTVGLDPGIRRRIWALIKKIQADGRTIFLTTHYIEEAEWLADRVAFLSKGKLVALDTPQKLMDDVGQWAADTFVDDELESRFFATREEAATYASEWCESCTVRRVNLEDAFLAVTGSKIA